MITVVGSLNVDFTVSVDRRPKLGETILSKGLNVFYGGKGGNQAVSAAKMGQAVSFIGAVGNDPYGYKYMNLLNENDIGTEYVSIIDDVSSGMAMITIEDNDNSIIYSEGANGKLTADHIEDAKELIAKSDVIVIQFEITHEVVEKVLTIADELSIPVILNPAPYKTFPIKWLEKITYITPNEQEYASIVSSDSYDEKYQDKFIITLGKKGAAFYQNGNRKIVKAPKVDAKDTTGAGDTFNGVLAHYIAEGKALEIACKKAVYAASLSTTKFGAQSGMPTKTELDEFMNNNDGLA